MKAGGEVEKIIMDFIFQVEKDFKFLEEMGYKRIESIINNNDYYPDEEVVIRYVSKSIGVEIFWYFAGANIGVAFIELCNGEFPDKKVFFGECKEASKAINLYTLSNYMNKCDNELFLLKDVDNNSVTKIKQREKIILENMSGVIDGLSIAVRNLARSIIDGDTSDFEDVMEYQAELLKKLYS